MNNDNWKKVRLGEAFDLQMGKTPDRNNIEYWNTTDNKWISIADISKSGKFISKTKEYISNEAVSDSGIKMIPKNTVIMSFKLSIGKTAITSEDCYSNEAIMAFHNNGKYEIHNDYLYHLFTNKDWSEGANKAVKGITLNKASLSVAQIPLPPLETQKQIAATLDKVTKLIAEQKELLAKYDILIKSRFIEMFGDPVINDKDWNTQTVEASCDTIYGGGTPSKSHSEYYLGKIPWVSSKDMKNDYILDSQDHITEDAVKNSTAKMVPVNSVIMVIRSGILKHTLPVAVNKVPITVNQDLKVFIPKKDINPIFFARQFKMLEKDILSGVRAVTADNIEFNSLKNRTIPVPPLELQQQFAAFVQQIDKSKFENAIMEVAA